MWAPLGMAEISHFLHNNEKWIFTWYKANSYRVLHYHCIVTIQKKEFWILKVFHYTSKLVLSDCLCLFLQQTHIYRVLFFPRNTREEKSTICRRFYSDLVFDSICDYTLASAHSILLSSRWHIMMICPWSAFHFSLL